MSITQILVVEDEGLVAEDLKCALEGLGYGVPAVAATGRAAISKAEETRPDLALMDIVLRGDMDGTEAADQISTRFGIPVVYLTAHADDRTLQRAKATGPFGYVLKPFDEGELHCVIETALQKHQTERMITQSEKHFRSLIEHASDLIAILDSDFTIRYASPSHERVLGYEEQEVIGTCLVDFVHPDDAGGVVTVLDQTIENSRAIRTVEFRCRHADGRWRVLEAVCNSRLDDPAVAGIVVNARDITKRVRAEDALQRAQDSLQQRIVTRTTKLVRAKTALRREIADRENVTEALRDNVVQLLAAQRMQERLLPDGPPGIPGFDIAGALCPAEFTAGDCFDYLAMPGGTLGVAVGDVAGHGFAAALIMAATHTLLRSLAETRTDVAEILDLANTALLGDIGADRLVTLLLVCIDPRNGSLVYASAGHPTGYVFNKSGDVKAHLKSTSLPLAALPDVTFLAGDPVVLEPGDVVLLVTDGIQEARSPKGKIFSTQRLLEIARANIDRTAGEIIESLFSATREFSRRQTQTDDITAVAIKVMRLSTDSHTIYHQD